LLKLVTVDFFLWLGIWFAINLFNIKRQSSFWKKDEKPAEFKDVKLLGRNQWQFIHSAIVFDHHWIVAPFNNNFKEQWLLEKEISIDELIDTYHGKSPCHVYIPNKPHPNGHEEVSISRNHSISFLYSMLLYFGGARDGTLTVVNSLLDRATKCHVVMDSWFPGKESMEWLDNTHHG